MSKTVAEIVAEIQRREEEQKLEQQRALAAKGEELHAKAQAIEAEQARPLEDARAAWQKRLADRRAEDARLAETIAKAQARRAFHGSADEFEQAWPAIWEQIKIRQAAEAGAAPQAIVTL
ncbi:MAG: hypothetical protein WCF84_10335 [Anaerolineae bacterium]